MRKKIYSPFPRKAKICLRQDLIQEGKKAVYEKYERKDQRRDQLTRVGVIRVDCL